MARSKPEQDLQNEGRLCIGSLPFVRLYRNNVGTLFDRNGTPVSYGLAIGSADTIGIVAPNGRFLSIEWKRPGWKPPALPTDGKKPNDAQQRHIDQCNWSDQINAQGGVAGFAATLTEGLFLVRLAMCGGSVAATRRDDPESVKWVLETERLFRERMTERAEKRSNRDR